MHCIGHLIVRWQWIILNNAFYVHCIAWSSHDLKGLTMNDSCVFIENDGSRRKFSKTHTNAKYSPIHNGATKFEFYTGKSLSEALIFASTNPHYDNRLFIELKVQYMKIPSSNLGRTGCVQKLFLTFRTIFVHNMFSPCSAKRKSFWQRFTYNLKRSP